MAVLSNPGTYGTRKCCSWCADIHKDSENRHPEIQKSKIQKSKTAKIQKSKNQKIKKKLQDSVDVKNFEFLDFWIFCFLHLCFQTVETAPKLDSEKTAFVSIFTVFLRGVRVVGG